jgi:heat shock protein HslJ
VLVDILGNLSYSGLFPDQQITLIDGYAYYDEGDGGNPFVRLIDRLIVTGDLNEDGTEDAVALLADYATGSGDFVFLTVVLDVWNEPTPTEAFMVGDRIPVKSLTIDGSQMIMELIGPGPGDAACCPTWNVRKVFEFVDGKLVERSSEELSKASLNNLSGTSWRLFDLNTGQDPVLPETEITLKFEDGQINGSAGCNTYNSAVSGDENMPQVFTVSRITTTRLVCPDPIANQETAYLDHLSKVTRWRYDFGYLALSYTLGEVIPGELLFAPQTP